MNECGTVNSCVKCDSHTVSYLKILKWKINVSYQKRLNNWLAFFFSYGTELMCNDKLNSTVHYLARIQLNKIF